MKVWVGYGSEHSANLVIIGTFKDASAANEANSVLEQVTQAAEAAERAGSLKVGGTNTSYPPGFLDLLAKLDLMDFGYDDAARLLLEWHARLDGNRFIITTEETEIGALLKVLINHGAKIEVYSAHEHGGPYGRNTKGST